MSSQVRACGTSSGGAAGMGSDAFSRRSGDGGVATELGCRTLSGSPSSMDAGTGDATG
jgi:hypothetical protein